MFCLILWFVYICEVMIILGIRHTIISISKSGEKHKQNHAKTMFEILMALFTRQNQFTEQEQWRKKQRV